MNLYTFKNYMYILISQNVIFIVSVISIQNSANVNMHTYISVCMHISVMYILTYIYESYHSKMSTGIDILIDILPV